MTTIPLFIRELYEKCYAKGDMLGRKLIRTATFKQHDYDNLQKSLNEALPTRLQEDYDGENVQSIKESAIDVALHQEQQGTGDDDDATLVQDDGQDDNLQMQDNEIPLPATVSLLDLRPLRLEYSPFTESVILIRKEYDEIAEHFRCDNASEPSHGCRLITGQPGIGKRYLIYYIFILLLLDKRSFGFQYDNLLIWIDSEGLKLVDSFHHIPGSDIWIVVRLNEPGRVHASVASPDAKRFRILSAMFSMTEEDRRRILSDKDGQVLGLPCWSWQDCFVAGNFLYPYDLTPPRLLSAFTKFGPIPRTCFHASESNYEEQVASDFLRRTLQLL